MHAAPFFDRAAFGVLLALIVWAPIPLGSNRPWAWSILEAAVFTTGLLWLAAFARREVLPGTVVRAAAPALALFAGWLVFVLLQWTPMPADWVRLLSPEAARLHALADTLQPGRPITLSVDPHATRVFWLKSCAYAAAFALTLLLVRSRSRLQWLCMAFVASGVGQAFYGILMHLSGTNIEILGTQIPHAAQASGAYVNRNHLAGMLELCLAVGIGLMIAQMKDRPPRNLRQHLRDLAVLLLSPRAALRLLLVIMVIALVMTRSRMGNTAFFASLLVAAVVGLIFSRHATRSIVTLIVSLIVVDALMVGAWFGVERTLERIEQTTLGQVEARVDPSIYAMGMLRDHPWFGTGGGTFYTAYSKYRGHDIDAFYDHAHNDYVQFLAEAGLIGATLLALLVAGSLMCAVLTQSRRRDPLARGVAFAVVMGVAAIGIHSTVDFNLQIPANAFLFTVLLAMAWIAYHLDRSGRRANGAPDAQEVV